MSEKKNKGEFAEFYAFLKLLYDGSIRNRKIRYIKRFETGNPKAVTYTPWVDGVVIVDGASICIPDMGNFLARFFSEIISGQGASFHSPMSDFFTEKFGIKCIKAGSNEKDDFSIAYENAIDEEPLCGYDVKADFAAPPCIINAGFTTNFVFKVYSANGSPVTDFDCEIFNLIIAQRKLIRGRLKVAVQILVDEGYQFSFSPENPDNAPPKRGKYLHQQFSTDERDLIPKLLLEYFSNSKASIKQVLNSFMLKNSDYLRRHEFWEEQIKNVLQRCYRGYYNQRRKKLNKERLNTVFAGSIGVQMNGELSLEPLDSKQTLEETLYGRCVFDTGSLNKHEFGTMYKENGNTYLKLNFSVKLSKPQKKKKNVNQNINIAKSNARIASRSASTNSNLVSV